MPRKLRQDGIKTLEDLQSRCRLNEETGCLIWAGARKATSPRVWIAEHGVMSMTGALMFLTTGKKPGGGKFLVPKCRNPDCANMSHRKLGTRSDLFAALTPSISATHKARIVASLRKTSSLYTPELAREIRASNEPARVLAERYGMHMTHVCRIRRGEAWRDSLPGSSVWSGL